jgi:hypothetical protein
VELYDYRTQSGRLELHNGAGHSELEPGLRAAYKVAFDDELREPLPLRLLSAHARGFADYFSTARHVAVAAAANRKRHAEREREEGLPPNSALRPREQQLPFRGRPSLPLRREI